MLPRCLPTQILNSQYSKPPLSYVHWIINLHLDFIEIRNVCIVTCKVEHDFASLTCLQWLHSLRPSGALIITKRFENLSFKTFPKVCHMFPHKMKIFLVFKRHSMTHGRNHVYFHKVSYSFIEILTSLYIPHLKLSINQFLVQASKFNVNWHFSKELSFLKRPLSWATIFFCTYLDCHMLRVV